MDAEFILKNASVIEGSGLAPYKGHIHIIDGEIKAVIKEDSKLPKEKIETIDPVSYTHLTLPTKRIV